MQCRHDCGIALPASRCRRECRPASALFSVAGCIAGLISIVGIGLFEVLLHGIGSVERLRRVLAVVSGDPFAPFPFGWSVFFFLVRGHGPYSLSGGVTEVAP